MEEYKDNIALLDLITSPGFCVRNNLIVKVNQAASRLFIDEGADIRSLLLTGCEEYAAFSGGCLYLSIRVSGQEWGASVSRTDEGDIFVIDEGTQEGELRALSLAARELRGPLNALMLAADHLSARDTDSEGDEQTARLNRSISQLLRIIGNMSDAGSSLSGFRPQYCDIGAVLREIFEKCQALTASCGISLTFESMDEQIICLADSVELERAVLNILSNAAKFTPAGGHIRAVLTRRGRMLQLCITDSGSGIPDELRSSVYRRFLRQPVLEDSRYGIGLGLVLVRTAAGHHGGTVLIDHPEGEGTRITVTIAIRQDEADILHSPILRVDYAGERDHALLELSDVLPSHLYRNP